MEQRAENSVKSRHVTLRMEMDSFDRLDQQSRRTGQTRSQLAKTLLDEGLRMEAHPGIMFRSGPAGRRAGLAAGPDVWEIARVLRELRGEPDDVVKETARLMGLHADQVWRALHYYAEFRDEIDAWIQANEDEAERAEAAWRRERAILQ